MIKGRPAVLPHVHTGYSWAINFVGGPFLGDESGSVGRFAGNDGDKFAQGAAKEGKIVISKSNTERGLPS